MCRVERFRDEESHRADPVAYAQGFYGTGDSGLVAACRATTYNSEQVSKLSRNAHKAIFP